MAEVSRSVSLTKKFSSVNDVSTRHMYDGVFASPPPPRNSRLNGSAAVAFTSRIEDYGEIFASSPSQTVPSPIPILDLPAADRRIPGIDYSGVFGGGSGDDRIGVSFEELVAGQSKKPVKAERQFPPRPRSPVQMSSLDTKSQEFPVTSGKYRTSNSSWTRPSKSQEFPLNSGTNQKPDSSGSVLTSKIPRKQPSRSQEFPLNTGNNSVPTSLANDQAATPRVRQPSISQESPLNNGFNKKLSSESSGQSFDTAKHFSVSYNKINNLNADGTTHIAELNAVPGYTCLFNEVDLPKKKVLNNMSSDVSPSDANVNMDDIKKRSQGKMTRAVSNPGAEKQACEQSTRFQRGFSGPLNSLDDRQEVDCKPQHPSFSSPWGPHSFGNESFFKRSTSQMSKGSPNDQQEVPGVDSLLSLLEEELDANSEAAISAEAVRRVIEEAELQIRLAKRLLQGNDSNGSINLSFKDTLKVRAPSGIECSNETNVLLKQKKVKIRSEKKHIDEVKGPKPRYHVQGNGARETKLGDVADRVKEKPHEDAVRVDPASEMAVNSGSSCAYATAEEVSQYTEQREPLNQTKEEVVDRSSIPEESQLAQKNHRQEVVGGEWEPAKQISQLFSGMKNRFVSFMSKQPEIVKKEPRMDVPNAGSLSGQSSENAFNVTKNVDAHKKPETGREELSVMEAEVNMRAAKSLGAGESEENLHKIGAQTEISEIDASEVKYGDTIEHEKDVEEVTLFPDSRNNNDESCDLLTPNIEVEKIETGVFGMDEQQENIVTMFPDGMKDIGVPSDHPEPEIEVGKRVQEYEVNEQQQKIVTMSPDDINKHNDEVGDHPEPEIEVGKQVQEFMVNEQLEKFSEKLTMSPEAEKRNVEPRCQPEPELSTEECKFGKENVASEVKGDSNMGEAEEISRGRSGNSTRLGHENGQMDTAELKEDVERVEETCSSLAANDDDGETTSWESSDEIETELMFQAKADDSFHRANGSSRCEEIKIGEEDTEEHRGEEAENAWDMQQNPENIKVLEETAAIEEPSNREEDEETLGGEEMEDLKPGDVLGAKLSGHTEAIDDASDHNEHLTATDDASEHNEHLAATDGTSEHNKHLAATDGTSEHNEHLAATDAASEHNEHLAATDAASEHNEHLPATDDACKLVEFSFLSRNEEYHEQGVQSCESPDEQLSCGDMEAMTELNATITKPAEEPEQTPSVEVADKSIQEEVTVDMDKIKEETKDGSGALRVNFCIWPCETKQDSEQELDDAEAKGFRTSDSLDNQGDKVDGKSEAATVLSGPNLDSDNDQSDEAKGEEKHSTESSSHRRRRWFESREEVEVHQQPSILVQEMPVEIIQEMKQHIKELKSDDCVEIHVDNIVEESKEDINRGLDEGALDKDGGGHSNTETSHRRRRWFDNSLKTGVPQKPTLFNGNGTCKDMDQVISDESKVDEPCQGGVEEAGSERRDATVRGSHLGSDQGENRNNIEAAHRRKRWFENGEKLGPGQRVGILEGNGSTVEVKDETVTRENVVKHDQHSETSTTERESSDSYRKADSESIRQQRDMVEENNRRKEKEKERIAVERAIREARERAFVEARERAERAAAEKANVEARLKAAAQERAAGRDANNKSASDKASVEAKLRAERAAVERATAEARERALQRAVSDKAANRVREKDNKTQTSNSSTSVRAASVDKSSGVINESPQRRKARMERNQRTMERAAKALEEKNMRDALVQREQAERNKFADSLDIEVKRWSNGKEGNLRALLSTLQYVLGTESGWQPISLTDLINPTAVRKAYKRAALCVHPDKLQQRGASIQQKYICEKVFDLLKDAWYKFNPDDR